MSSLKAFVTFPCKTVLLGEGCTGNLSSVPDSPGLVDFVVRQVNSVVNLLDQKLKFLGEFKYSTAQK